ncbi:MAG: VWA domain-containing protein [Bacteroidia bacterium]|nr:VWA domain-containing protein [Bacteroidia bacterium]
MNDWLTWIFSLQWSQPWYLVALALPCLWLTLYYVRRQEQASFPLPGSHDILATGKSWRTTLALIQPWLRFFGLSLLIVALARPRQAQGEEKIETDAIDIMMAIDVSSSMNAMDFQPNRFVAAKKTASEFIDMRPNDRIGLVVFSAQAFTQSPLTNDHKVLKLLLEGVQQGWVENGTAIGLGLATSVLRLKESETLSKVVILLTDGVNNRFEVNPIDAMQLAEQYDIRVYTIGMGTNGLADVPKTDFAGNTVIVQEPVEIDEELLTQIATETGGKYYRATDLETLQKVYEEIDLLEKMEMEVTRFVRYEEWFWPFALAALVLLMLELLVRYAAARRLPE